MGRPSPAEARVREARFGGTGAPAWPASQRSGGNAHFVLREKVEANCTKNRPPFPKLAQTISTDRPSGRSANGFVRSAPGAPGATAPLTRRLGRAFGEFEHLLEHGVAMRVEIRSDRRAPPGVERGSEFAQGFEERHFDGRELKPRRLGGILGNADPATASDTREGAAEGFSKAISLERRVAVAADVLQPLRAMIDFTLREARSSRYGHAARHLAACARMAERIEDWRAIEAHEAYVARLRAEHGRKSGFRTRTA